MTPVAQSKLYSVDGIHNGNCFAACLASLLELPLWMVPPFEDMFGRSRDDVIARADRWLRTLNGVALVRTNGHALDALPEFYIANGPAPRGVRHSVIYRAGEMVHDPHPSGDGIKVVEWTWHLAELRPVTADEGPAPAGEQPCAEDARSASEPRRGADAVLAKPVGARSLSPRTTDRKTV